MKYAILINPVSGKLSIEQKKKRLAPVAKVFDCEIFGLSTQSADELKHCAIEVAKTVDVLIIAGGDGTFSDIINAVDTCQNIVAYLPMGTANALRYTLGYPRNLLKIAEIIKTGNVHEYDLIHCDEQYKAFMVSLGFEGLAIRCRDDYVKKGITGLTAYFLAAIKAYFIKYKRQNARLILDDEKIEVTNLLSLIIIKQPYYGYGIKVVPNARFDDRQLHVLSLNSGIFKFLLMALSAITIGNRFGQFYQCQTVRLETDLPLTLQVDGNAAWQATQFNFKLLPNALKIKH